MNLFDEIEKFIYEHDSPPVLKEHLAYIKEQMAVLIRENAMLKNKLSLTVAENKVLETQINDLKRTISDSEDT